MLQEADFIPTLLALQGKVDDLIMLLLRLCLHLGRSGVSDLRLASQSPAPVVSPSMAKLVIPGGIFSDTGVLRRIRRQCTRA